jgi:hypothetical protein
VELLHGVLTLLLSKMTPHVWRPAVVQPQKQKETEKNTTYQTGPGESATVVTVRPSMYCGPGTGPSDRTGPMYQLWDALVHRNLNSHSLKNGAIPI